MGNNNLYVITVIFNPRRFKSRYNLYRDFKTHMEASGAKLFTVEISFGERPFEVTSPNDPMNLQLHTNTELWHKERGLNLGFEQLFKQIPTARYCAWIDSDISFTRKGWVEETVYALHHYSVIQPFSEAQFILPTYESNWKCQSECYMFDQRGFHQDPEIELKDIKTGHPGLAWAIKKEDYLAIGGLLDVCIAGSGDTYMINSFKGDAFLHIKEGMTPGFAKYIKNWGDNAHEVIRENIGYVMGAVQHFWHGPSELRGYDTRGDIANFNEYDPTTDLVLGLNGLYQWAGNKIKLEQDIRRSLSSRDEDSTAFVKY